MSNPRWNPVHRVQNIANPAAGAEWTFSPQNAAGCWIYAVRYLLVTSAAVGTRFSSLLVTDGTNRYLQVNPANSQGPGATRGYMGVNGISIGSNTSTSFALDWPANGLYLPPGFVLSSFTEARDAGDQYQTINLGMWEFPTGAPFAMFPVPHFFTQSSE